MTGGVLRPTSDVSRGQWVIDELGPWATFAGIVPPRFAAYARIGRASCRERVYARV